MICKRLFSALSRKTHQDVGEQYAKWNSKPSLGFVMLKIVRDIDEVQRGDGQKIYKSISEENPC